MGKEKCRRRGVIDNENHMGKENIDIVVLFIMKIIWLRKNIDIGVLFIMKIIWLKENIDIGVLFIMKIIWLK